MRVVFELQARQCLPFLEVNAGTDDDPMGMTHQVWNIETINKGLQLSQVANPPPLQGVWRK